MPKTIFDPKYQAIVLFLTEKRRSMGITQADLAQNTGFEQSDISKIERLVRRIDIVEFFLICDALKIQRAEAYNELLQILDGKAQ